MGAHGPLRCGRLLLVALLAPAGAAPAGAAPAGVESALLYGGIGTYAYYFTDLLIGQPQPQRVSVIVDTGSRLVAFPCSGCAHCGKHLDPAFNITRSGTARWVNCSTGCDDRCLHGCCSYSETYSEGSSISGSWFVDEMELGDAVQRNPPVRTRMGCHQDENNLFYTQRANGIMGLAPSQWGRQPTVLQDLFRDKRHVSTEIFTLCLAKTGGRLTVGGYDASYHVNGTSIQWMRLHPDKFYYLFPTGLQLAGSALPVGPGHFGDTIVDSGTTYTYLPQPAFSAFIDALNTYCRAHDGCGADQVDDECWRVRSTLEGPEQFPTLTLFFDNDVQVDWGPSRYMQPRGTWGTWCRTVLENQEFQTVLGLSFMVHKDVIFDIGSRRLGLAEAHCPEHLRQPTLFQQAWSRTGVARPVVRLGVRRPAERLTALVMCPLLAALVASLVFWAARRAWRTVPLRALLYVKADTHLLGLD